MDRGAWWSRVHGVAELDMTKWLSTHANLRLREKYLTRGLRAPFFSHCY